MQQRTGQNARKNFILGCPIPTGASEIHSLQLKLRDHHRRGNRMIIREDGSVSYSLEKRENHDQPVVFFFFLTDRLR